MALTRKFLTAMGIEADKVDEIITAHTETVNALKEERDGYKKDAEKVSALQQEVEDLKNGEDSGYKAKYDTLKQQYDDYKASVEAEKATSLKESAYRALLKEVNVSDKRIDAILKVTDLKDLELDKEGKFKDADKLKKTIEAEWADFIVTEKPHGVDTPKPPKKISGTDFDGLSLIDKMKYANENPDDVAVKAWLQK